jgi:hypothetical protein
MFVHCWFIYVALRSYCRWHHQSCSDTASFIIRISNWHNRLPFQNRIQLLILLSIHMMMGESKLNETTERHDTSSLNLYSLFEITGHRSRQPLGGGGGQLWPHGGQTAPRRDGGGVGARFGSASQGTMVRFARAPPLLESEKADRRREPEGTMMAGVCTVLVLHGDTDPLDTLLQRTTLVVLPPPLDQSPASPLPSTPAELVRYGGGDSPSNTVRFGGGRTHFWYISLSCSAENKMLVSRHCYNSLSYKKASHSTTANCSAVRNGYWSKQGSSFHYRTQKLNGQCLHISICSSSMSRS